MELNPLSFELVLICPRSSDSGADLLVLNLFDIFPYSHFDPLLKRAYPHCILLYCKLKLEWKYLRHGLGTHCWVIPPNLDWWLNEAWNRVHWMIHISMDSSVEWFFHNWIFCLSPQPRMTNDFCHEHQALTFEMEDVRDPSAEAQLADASMEFQM